MVGRAEAVLMNTPAFTLTPHRRAHWRSRRPSASERSQCRHPTAEIPISWTNRPFMDKPSFLLCSDAQGRVVIPDWLRALCGIHEGAEYRVRVEGDKVVLERLKPDGPTGGAPETAPPIPPVS